LKVKTLKVNPKSIDCEWSGIFPQEEKVLERQKNQNRGEEVKLLNTLLSLRSVQNGDYYYYYLK